MINLRDTETNELLVARSFCPPSIYLLLARIKARLSPAKTPVNHHVQLRFFTADRSLEKAMATTLMVQEMAEPRREKKKILNQYWAGAIDELLRPISHNPITNNAIIALEILHQAAHKGTLIVAIMSFPWSGLRLIMEHQHIAVRWQALLDGLLGRPNPCRPAVKKQYIVPVPPSCMSLLP